MTDRHSGYIVVLDHDVREDDAEVIRSAISMIQGVISVQPILNDPLAESIARSRLANDIRERLRDLEASLYG